MPANHLDGSPQAILESNYMTNIVPQHANNNVGAWLYTEEVIECVRDIAPLIVIGGIIIGDNTTNDLFIQTHGVRTPDFLWKIVKNTINEDVIAWLMPNDEFSVRANVDLYLTTIGDIESKTGFVFPLFTQMQRSKLANSSWPIPVNCNKG